MLVVDLTRYLPGAFASRELQRLGARRAGRAAGGGSDAPRRAGLGRGAERGQESVACDLKERELAQALLARVVLEGFRPGVAARLGPDDAPPRRLLLDHGLRPRGSVGRAGHLNYAGWAHARGHRAGAAAAQPADLAAGSAVAQILAALLERTHRAAAPA